MINRYFGEKEDHVMIERTAKAHWAGNIKQGKGHLSLGSGAFEGNYSFGSRFEDQQGTNPEELIGAAHAGCFSMALSLMLEEAGYPPLDIQTEAKVTLAQIEGMFRIVSIHLDTEADVPGMDEAAFVEQAGKAKENCPVSHALQGPEIFLKATLKK
jgi:osmotically inducible protein OsmC